MIPVGRQQIFIMPDRILVYEARQVGAVEYHDCVLESNPTYFIEDDKPPTDASTVSMTWRYTNKNGGPDRRFKDNPSIPVMEYRELLWQSSSGLYELLHVSNVGHTENFAAAFKLFTQGVTAQSTIR